MASLKLSTLNFLSTLLLLSILLGTQLVLAAPQGVPSPTEPPSILPPYSSTSITTSTSSPSPSDTPSVFLDFKRGIQLESLDPISGEPDGHFGGPGRKLLDFQFNNSYTAATFRALIYPDPEPRARMTGPDPLSYASWTTEIPKFTGKCVLEVTASPTIDVTIELSRSPVPTQTPITNDVAQLSCQQQGGQGSR